MTNPRYSAYAAAHGETPDGMLVADQVNWPGGSMTGFTIWIDGKWREWCALTYRSRSALTDADQAAFDAWLVTPEALSERKTECQSIRGEWAGVCPDCGQRLPAKPGPLSARTPSPHARPPSKNALGVKR